MPEKGQVNGKKVITDPFNVATGHVPATDIMKVDRVKYNIYKFLEGSVGFNPVWLMD